MKMGVASFVGNEDNKTKEKYSLNNLNKYSAKKYSLPSLRSGYQFKTSWEAGQQVSANGIEVYSMLRYEKGNTAYVFPYKYKVKTSRFVTPSSSH
jgi:hypothetical protein